MPTDWLAQRARISPDKVALIWGEQQWDYAGLDEQVGRLAGQLAAAGVSAGERVAVLLPNCPEFVFLIHALARLGAVLIPLNLRLTVEELHGLVEQAQPRWLVCDQETEARTIPLTQKEQNTFVVSHESGSQEPFVVSHESGSPQKQETFVVSHESGSQNTFVVSHESGSQTLQSIIFTSGTTGRPKGAMLTFDNHFWSATASAFRLGHQPNDRWLLCMPLYHVGGMAIVLRCCLYGTSVVLHPRFDVAAVDRAVEEAGVTLVSLVPTMLQRWLAYRRETPLPKGLRMILLGGAAAGQDLLERCRRRGWPIATTYGLTEAASQVATATPDEVRHKPGSVGKPLMFTSVRVVDAQGQELPPGEVGEILVGGPTVMRGYFRQPQETAEALSGGFLRTGDLGYLDEEGDLWVVQRRSDLIVSGGENVYPAEVEAVLRGHSSVREVCVVGEADAEWGQRVVAVVVPNGEAPRPSLLIDYCRQHLAGYKIPRRVVFVEHLPRTASGKVNRRKVQELISSCPP